MKWAAQDEYYHVPDNNTTVLVIPSANDDYERLGILLEDMAYYFSQAVLLTYCETVIKIRRSPTPQVATMLDIIKNNIAYHYGLIYNIDATETINSESTSGNIASVFKIAEKRLNAQVKKVAQIIQNLP